MNKTQENIILEHFSNFNLEQKDIDMIIKKTYIKNFNENKILYQKDSCFGHIILTKGAIRAYIISENGKEITIFSLKENQSCIISASCLIGSFSFEIILEAQKDTEILVLPSEFYNTLNEKYQSISRYTMQILSSRFAEVINVLEQAIFTPLVTRVQDFLKQNQHSGVLNCTHEQIANHLGSAREAISRVLKDMEKKGEIKLKRGKIVLLKDSF